jgi:hypothetical protein
MYAAIGGLPAYLEVIGDWSVNAENTGTDCTHRHPVERHGFSILETDIVDGA